MPNSLEYWPVSIELHIAPSLMAVRDRWAGRGTVALPQQQQQQLRHCRRYGDCCQTGNWQPKWDWRSSQAGVGEIINLEWRSNVQYVTSCRRLRPLNNRPSGNDWSLRISCSVRLDAKCRSSTVTPQFRYNEINASAVGPVILSNE